MAAVRKKNKKRSGPTALMRVIWACARPFVAASMYLKYGFSVRKPVKFPEPCLILANHQTEDDMCFPVLLSDHQYFFFVAGEHIYRNPFMRFVLNHFCGAIPLAKGSIAADATMDMFQKMKAGYSICIFPEGARTADGRTNPIADSTGKLVRRSGLNLVTIRLSGGYLTAPRWTKHTRRGRMQAEVRQIYTAEELKTMSVSDINEAIRKDLSEDAYETQKIRKIRYRGKNKAEGMENQLFFCPCCKAFDTIRTKADSFFCTACGMNGVYNDYGYLESDTLPFDNVRDWIDFDEACFRTYCETEEINLQAEHAVLRVVNTGLHIAKTVSLGTLTIHKDGISIGDRSFSYAHMDATDYMGCGNIFLFTASGCYYDLRADRLYAVLIRKLYFRVKEQEAEASGKKFDAAK